MNGYNARMRRIALPRIQRIRRLRASGKTWEAIGSMLGISKQRAQQLAKRMEKP